MQPKSFDDIRNTIARADGTWMVDFATLNSSGVRATAVLAMSDMDGAPMLDVSIVAEGFSAGNTVVQHIHGTFDEDGTPTDARTPTLASDMDGDGIVEVLEGVPSYGDVLLPLLDGEGEFGMASDGGDFVFMARYDLTDDSLFGSPVTGADYTADDIMPLALREIVLHGVDVPAGIGAGTEGEVNGDQDGFVQILPAAAGEIEEISAKQARAILSMQADALGGFDRLTAGDDSYAGSMGDDVAFGRAGGDTLIGGGGDDTLRGGKGADLIVGGDGDDKIVGGKGLDIFGGLAGDDTIKGGRGMDEFHFDAGTGTDTIRDFTQGEDVISLLDGGAIDFANSDEDGTDRGDSDLSPDDFAFVWMAADLDMSMDGKVVYSGGGTDDLAAAEGPAIEAYIAATDGKDTFLYYDEDWSDTAGRETLAVLNGVDEALTVFDFDVY